MLIKCSFGLLNEIYKTNWIWRDFPLYFTKGSQKKVRHHLEWSHINSKMCSVISEDNRSRIQPVPEHFRHFAHFVTRYCPVLLLFLIIFLQQTCFLWILFIMNLNNFFAHSHFPFPFSRRGFSENMLSKTNLWKLPANELSLPSINLSV